MLYLCGGSCSAKTHKIPKTGNLDRGAVPYTFLYGCSPRASALSPQSSDSALSRGSDLSPGVPASQRPNSLLAQAPSRLQTHVSPASSSTGRPRPAPPRPAWRPPRRLPQACPGDSICCFGLPSSHNLAQTVSREGGHSGPQKIPAGSCPKAWTAESKQARGKSGSPPPVTARRAGSTKPAVGSHSRGPRGSSEAGRAQVPIQDSPGGGDSSTRRRHGSGGRPISCPRRAARPRGRRRATGPPGHAPGRSGSSRRCECRESFRGWVAGRPSLPPSTAEALPAAAAQGLPWALRCPGSCAVAWPGRPRPPSRAQALRGPFAQ